jgi:hypothetical protein
MHQLIWSLRDSDGADEPVCLPKGLTESLCSLGHSGQS